MKQLTFALTVLVMAAPVFAQESERKYLGRYSTNPYAADSTSNPVGRYGSSVSSESITNPVGTYGRAARSRFGGAGSSPVLEADDGTYLGRVNKNRYDPESISNPFGRYGSRFSKDSVNNPFGRYGSPFSSESAKNPLARKAPRIYSKKK